ncbi:MAG: hypothetical protein A3E84_02005 [Gammaproteobacteria bacterium RIFCSPHIGHO2_12_FULL_42_13]|nr:MAG: hypothetical protein A3E84_02005 [Gammaproteobacteria bacterium RIFCSPHIGHO2_12_FULL_42_13]
MDTLQAILSHILHIDSYLIAFAGSYGAWTYALLFAIIFCETGLIITPFLPGDSLLFAAGALTAHTNGAISVHWLFVLLTISSILGNAVNYLIGRLIGPRVFSSPKSHLFNQAYLTQAHAFYQRHGGKTIIIARFIPIIRTFGPFIAGIADMNYRHFFIYNILGAVLWIGSLLYASFFFGTLPIVRDNFSLIVVAIVFVSLLPPIIAFAYRKLSAVSQCG